MRLVKILVTVVMMLVVPAKATLAAEPVHLKGVNVLEGDATGYVPVRISKQVSVDSAFLPNKSVTASGTGRLQALVLRRAGAKPTDDALLAAGRFDPGIFCQDECANPVEGISVIGGKITISGEGRWQVPAGDYQLYLITDGGPAKVTLRLPELEGEQHLSPTVRTSAQTKVLPPRSAAQVKNLRVFGDSHRLTNGIIFETHALYYGQHAYSDLWTCWYTGEPTHPLAFYPGCPTEADQEGLSLWIQYGLLHPAPGLTVGVGLFRPSLPAIYGAGGSMTSVSTARSAGWAATWIEFDSLGAMPTTPSEPAPTPGTPGQPNEVRQPPPASPAGSAASRVRLLSRRLGVSGRRASVGLRCDGSSDCRGEIDLAGVRRPFTIAAGRSARVRVPISSALARRARRGKGTLATLSIANGGAVQTVRATLRGARR
jgi:hypothetical protein